MSRQETVNAILQSFVVQWTTYPKLAAGAGGQT